MTTAPVHPGIVLVGPPGAGKTTVAHALAERLELPMTDTDQVVEGETGSTVADLFIERGEAEFRRLEEAAVRTEVDRVARDGGVLALGGGAVLSVATRAVLNEAPVEVVFLDVSLTAAVKRVGMEASRPLLLGNVRGTLKRLLDEREPLYREVADIVIVTDDVSPDDVTAQIVERLNGDPA